MLLQRVCGIQVKVFRHSLVGESIFYFFSSHWAEILFFACPKKSIQKKRHPVASVPSEFLLFYALSGFDSHPCSAKPGSPSMARAYFISSKNSKTHTPAHGGNLLTPRIELTTAHYFSVLAKWMNLHALATRRNWLQRK